MSRTAKKICPITKSDEIIVTYLNSEELVTTQRKTIGGKYERVLKPRKEVKTSAIEVNCPSQGHPALDVSPSSLGLQLWKGGKAWCRKTQKVCPMEQIIQDLL